MNGKKFFALLLAGLTLTGSLTGCQLAKEETDAATGDDRLIGVFITTEYLDLFDFEAYLNDNLSDMLDGEVVVDDTTGYQNVIWAELVKETSTNDDGETATHWNYEFPVEGFAYFAPVITDPETGDQYFSADQSEGIVSGGWHFTSGTTESIEGSATIYFAPESGAVAEYYTNPVYQTEDGRVYLTSGHGSSFDTDSEGMVCSTTLEASTTTSDSAGEQVDYSASISVSFETMLPVEQVVVLQMDGAGTVLSRTEYSPDALPEVITPETGAEYLIVESCKHDSAGEEVVTRELIGQEDKTFTAFTLREDGTCIPKAVTVEWEESTK